MKTKLYKVACEDCIIVICAYSMYEAETIARETGNNVIKVELFEENKK